MKAFSTILSFIIFLMIANVAISQVSVTTDGSAPDSSAMLDVKSDNSGALLPRMSTSQRTGISNPAEGLLVYDLGLHKLMIFDGTFWVKLTPENTGSSQASPLLNCLEIFDNGFSQGDGLYWIDPDGGGLGSPFQCFCDMTTDGGGWTLVMNYNHLGGTNPTTQIRTNDLPILGATSLGFDESGTPFWGHASNSMMNTLSFSEILFFGISQPQQKVINFKTNHPGTISYFTTGSGSCNGLQGNFTPFPPHNAILPLNITGVVSNQADNAMLYAPFYLNNTAYWNVGYSNTWNVDSWYGTNWFSYHTFHQVWVR